MVRVYPDYVGALVAVDRFGWHGAAAHGWNFSYSIRSSQMDKVEVIEVALLDMHLSPPEIHSRELGLRFHDWWQREGKYLKPCMKQAVRSLWPLSGPHPDDQGLHGKCPWSLPEPEPGFEERYSSQGEYLGPCMRQMLRSWWPFSRPQPDDHALDGKCP